MKKHPAALLLAIVVALGAGQAVPLSILQRSAETCAIVRIVKTGRERRLHRERIGCRYGRSACHFINNNESTATLLHLWFAQLLRAPPFSSIA